MQSDTIYMEQFNNQKVKALKKAKAFFKKMRFPEMLDSLQEAAICDPQDHQVHYWLAFYSIRYAQILEEEFKAKELIDRALFSIDTAIRLAPREAKYYEFKASILSFDLHKLDRAVEMINEAIKINPQSADSHAALADILSLQENWVKVDQSLREALRLDPKNPRAQSLFMLTYDDPDKADEVKKRMMEALNKDPEDPYACSALGLAYLSQEEYKMAEECFLKAVKADNSFDLAAVMLIRLLSRRSVVFRVYSWFDVLLQHNWYMYIFKGLFSSGIGRISQAIAHYFIPNEQLSQLIGLILGVLLFLNLVFMIHLAYRGVGNLLLYIDAKTRYALTPHERNNGLGVGGCLLLGLLNCLVGIVLTDERGLDLGVSFLFASVPFAFLFSEKNKWITFFYGSLGVLILLGGFIKFVLWYSSFPYKYSAVYGIAVGTVLIFLIADIAGLISTMLLAYGKCRQNGDDIILVKGINNLAGA